MTAKLQPGMVVQNAPGSSSYMGAGVVKAVSGSGDEQEATVVWSDGATTDTYAHALIRAEHHRTLKAGDAWNGWTADEVDLTSELMKVRVIGGEPGIWIDVRLFGMESYMVQNAALWRKAWLEADRQKLDWFKPGQIVKNAPGRSALARPATVIQQKDAETVELITSNGIAHVAFASLALSANSVQDLQAKEVQKREEVLAGFKTQVREKAMDAAEEHGWCEEVKTILQELGIKIPVNKVRAVLHLTVEIDAVVEDGTGMSRLNLEAGSNREWWGSTLKFEDDGKDLNLKDDDDLDMSEVEVRLISSRVEEIHDESYLEGE